MKALLELLPTDIGRPIAHFAQRFSNGHLRDAARQVLERLLPSDAEVVDDSAVGTSAASCRIAPRPTASTAWS